MNNQRLLIVLAVLIGIAAIGAGVGSYLAQQTSASSQPPDGVMWPNPKSFPDVTLYDQHGDELSADDLRNQWSLVFFGFTHCPDICPITLSVLDRVKKQATERGIPEDQLHVIFISVDPERDTPAKLKDYVNYFNQDFIGASGKPETLDKLTRSLGAVYYIGEPDAEGEYTVDHSASIFLFDPQTRLVKVFTTPHEAAAITEQLLAIRDFIQEQNN